MLLRATRLSAIANAVRNLFRGASLNMNFAGADTLDPRITFSRASNATVTGPDGVLGYAPHNLLTFSEQIDNSAWVKVAVNISANGSADPSGAMTADVVARSGDGLAVRNIRANFSTSQTGSYTYSQYVKPEGTSARVSLRLQDNAGVGGHCVFDLVGEGVVFSSTSAEGSVQRVGIWYRLSVTVTLAGSFAALQSILFFGAYGASIDPDSFSVWGAQLNVGPLQPYYPTTVKNLLGYTQEFDNAAWTKSNAFVQTNLLTFSEQFDAAGWQKTSAAVTANAAVAPDGSTTADLLLGTGSGSHYAYQGYVVSAGVAFTLSCYAKNFNLTGSATVLLRDFTEAGVASFNLATGTVNATTGIASEAAIVDVGNGWYRISAKFTPTTSGSHNVSPAHIPTIATTTGFYAWGAQLVQGSTPGDYQRTEAAAKAVMYPAPDGSLTADKLVENTASNEHYLRQSQSLSAGAKAAFSFYVKAAERSSIRLRILDSAAPSNGIFCSVDVSTGAVASGVAGAGVLVSAQAVNVGGGYFRLSMVGVASATATTLIADLFILSGNQLVGANHTGDGTSGIYIWGAQLSDSASLDPYVYNPEAAPTAQAYYGPRFDYDPVTLAPKGLLIEEQRTNLLLQSEDFSTAWTSSAPYSVSINVANAPSGQQTADALIVASGQSSFSTNVTRQSITKAASAIAHTHSVFCKALGATTSVRIVDFGASTSENASVVVSLVDGSVIGSPIVSGGFSAASVAVTSFGGGWFRVAFTFTTDAAASLTVRAFPYLGLSPLTGDGTSGLFIWGAQLEAGAFPTSYIPTTTAAATRAADVAVMTGANFSSWYNAATGAIFADYATTQQTGFPAIASASDGGNTNRIQMSHVSSARRPVVTAGGVAQWDTNGGVLGSASSGVFAKFALAYEAANYAAAVNGGTPSTQTSGTAPSGLNRLALGADGASGNFINGHIRRISYFSRRLTNSELEGITK